MPVRYNTLTKEPYLRLPAPHENIIITPHRLSEADMRETTEAMVRILNDPRVYPWLEGPPYPFRREDGEEWIKKICEDNEAALAELRREFEEGSPATSGSQLPDQQQQGRAQRFMDVCPLETIREIVEEDPESGHPRKDVFIGDALMSKYMFYEFPHASEERAEAQRNNKELATGDKNIVWGFGDYLSPTHHGRGIMTAVLRTIIHEWAIPRMNTHVIKSCAFVGNEGSLRVFEKNKFVRLRTLEDWSVVSESRGGGTKSIVLVKWEREV